ncbi:hypothetical protein, partial [Mycobacterium marinum]|uniref:hypothetical protein n=2 Tax=Mycobacterium marinum TaxID=1781 RepID=UPI0021C293A3
SIVLNPPVPALRPQRRVTKNHQRRSQACKSTTPEPWIFGPGGGGGFPGGDDDRGGRGGGRGGRHGGGHGGGHGRGGFNIPFIPGI